MVTKLSLLCGPLKRTFKSFAFELCVFSLPLFNCAQGRSTAGSGQPGTSATLLRQIGEGRRSVRAINSQTAANTGPIGSCSRQCLYYALLRPAQALGWRGVRIIIVLSMDVLAIG